MCQNIYRLQDSLPHVLGVLHIVTLIPYSREIIINATVSDGRVGMAVILDAIMTPADVKPEGVEPALHLLINLVCPPQSMTDESNAAIVPHQHASSELEKLEQGYRRILTFERSFYHVGDVSGCNRIRVWHIYLLSLAHCLQIHKFKWSYYFVGVVPSLTINTYSTRFSSIYHQSIAYTDFDSVYSKRYHKCNVKQWPSWYSCSFGCNRYTS
ncbi:hypothetical protein ABFS83_05G124700 [Erythranthe nasuta]